MKASRGGIVVILAALFAVSSGPAWAQKAIVDQTPVVEDFTSFDGTGFAPSPASGQLDSDEFSGTGMSDGNLIFGGTATVGDWARGGSLGGATTGGLYAWMGPDRWLFVQPAAADFNPGTLTVRYVNLTGQVLTTIGVSYQVEVFNDQARSSSWTFSYSTDGTIFIPVPALDVFSPTTADGSPAWVAVPRATTLAGLSVLPGGFFLIRFSSGDAGGSGNRDEIGVDKISVTAILSAPDSPPAGGEFRVNTYTTDYQDAAAVAMDASGNFVVAWRSHGQDGDRDGIFGQRLNAAGVAQGSEFQVNTFTTLDQNLPAVAAAGDGSFVVVWASLQDYFGSSLGIFGQRFDVDGARQGAEFQVNTYTPTSQYEPAVAAGTGGAFVVVWTSRSQDGILGGVFGQRFSGSGAPQGSEFRINSYTTGDQRLAAVASDASGRFVVVWSSYDEDGSGAGIFGRRYDASGTPQGGEFQVNTYTTGPQTDPSVASDASGNFVVVWHGSGQDGGGYGIRGRRFDAAGGAQGGEFLVNVYTSGNQIRPRVAAAADGRFTVVWNSSGQDGSSIGVFGRRFDATGAPQGAEFRANSYTLGAQRNAAVASDPQGDFVVVWDSLGQDGDLTEVFGQRYGDLIFADGLESGDLARWSSASTGGGDLAVSGAAAMGGTTHGLQAFVNDTGALYVQDATPEAETRYRARFYFDPNGFDPGEAESHFRTRIFIGFDPTGLRVVTLVLKRQAGAFSLEGRVRRNDGTRADTGFFPITDGPHFIEIDWRRSTGPGAINGTFELWIDNVSVATLAAIDDDQTPIDFARMGAIAVKTAAFGTLYYDQFESRRQRLIGP